LLYAQEVEVLTELDAPDRDKFMVEAAQAYRARSKALLARGRKADAQMDLERAVRLENKARKIARLAVEKKQSAAGVAASGTKAEVSDLSRQGRIRLINTWNEPVMVWVDRIAFRLEPGQQHVVIRQPGAFTYEIPAAQHKATTTLKGGIVYTIRIRPR
jgi:hypothetical protein